MRRLTLGVVIFLLGLLPQQISAQTPQINPGGIVNGASFAAGVAVAPGSIASVFGSNFGSSTAGVTVLMNGITAPLFAVSSQQVNFQVPWELAGQSQASLTVTVGGVTSSSVTVPLTTYGPGIFVAGSSGQGAILIANTASVAAPAGAFPGSRPVNPGEFISIYCTGLGPVADQPGTGSPPSGDSPSTTTALPTVTIGGVLGTVAFSGLAPGFFGLYQVNVQVPPPTGSGLPVVVSIGGSTSNTVTVAVGSPVSPQGGGPPGGIVQAIAIDPHSTDTLYAGTQYGGVFKSTNGGANWAAANSGLTSTVLVALAIDPSNTATVYAGTGGAGVFKSTNGGISWAPVNSGLTVRDFRALAIDPSNPATVYAGTFGGGVFKSTNGGASWAAVNSGLPTNTFVLALAIDPSNTATVYAVTTAFGNGAFKSTNRGASWAAVNSGLTATVVQALAIDPSNTATVYAGTSGSGVFKSTNGGTSWAAVNSGLTDRIVYALAIDPSNTTTVYAGTYNGGVFKSTNGGTSWTAVNSGLPIGPVVHGVFALAIDPSNTATVYAGTYGGGVFKSTDGAATWLPTGSN